MNLAEGHKGKDEPLGQQTTREIGWVRKKNHEKEFQIPASSVDCIPAILVSSQVQDTDTIVNN